MLGLSNQDSNPWEKRDKQIKCHNCMPTAEKESLGHTERRSPEAAQGTPRLRKQENQESRESQVAEVHRTKPQNRERALCVAVMGCRAHVQETAQDSSKEPA